MIKPQRLTISIHNRRDSSANRIWNKCVLNITGFIKLYLIKTSYKLEIINNNHVVILNLQFEVLTFVHYFVDISYRMIN